uniref:Nucleolin 2 n=1 Tax=Noccaea caerulescens TaxID=107243 RepID=A0A1J3G5U4_NOCCA
MNSEIIKKLQMNSDLLEISLKKMDDISNRLNVVTDFVEKQQQKESDLPVTSLKEKVEYKCCFESCEYEMKNPRTIFVKGFDCSLALDDIKNKLTQVFSSCGEVSEIYLPYHCKTGSSIGFAFINMRNDEKEALKLHGTPLGGMSLEVEMAYGRSEYSAYTNHRGCGHCRSHLMKRRRQLFNRTFKIKIGDGFSDLYSHLGPTTYTYTQR